MRSLGLPLLALLVLRPLLAADAPATTPTTPPGAPGAPGFGPSPGGARGGGGFGPGFGGRGRSAQPATPQPPTPFITQPALGGLRFEKPLAIASAPGDANRLFILEQDGKIFVIPDLAKPEKMLFLDLTAAVGKPDVSKGLMMLAFHPNWKTNRHFYVWFTRDETTAPGSSNRLSRFTVSAADPNVADPASELPILSQPDRGTDHNGGGLEFGPDGYLYVSLGDEAYLGPNNRGGRGDLYENSQKIDGAFFSGIIRIDVDRRPGNLTPNPHPAVHAGTYLVPRDNPWVGATSFNGAPVAPAKVRTEFWAVGLRNPWRMSIDPVTGLMWVGDIGNYTVEEVDIVRRGDNHGWSYREGNIATPAANGPPPREPPSGVKFAEPFFAYRHDDNANGGNCIIGGFVYRGTALPALRGRYLCADWTNGRVWALSPVDGTGPVQTELIARKIGITAFALDPRTDDVLLADLSGGTILRLAPNPNYPPPETKPAAPAKP
jgi:glucose/arabinose dehydrogenase